MILQHCHTSASALEDITRKLLCKYLLENVISLNKESVIQKACTAQGEGDKSSSLDQQQFLNYIHQIKLRYLNTFQSNGSSVEIISQFDEKN